MNSNYKVLSRVFLLALMVLLCGSVFANDETLTMVTVIDEDKPVSNASVKITWRGISFADLQTDKKGFAIMALPSKTKVKVLVTLPDKRSFSQTATVPGSDSIVQGRVTFTKAGRARGSFKKLSDSEEATLSISVQPPKAGLTYKLYLDGFPATRLNSNPPLDKNGRAKRKVGKPTSGEVQVYHNNNLAGTAKFRVREVDARVGIVVALSDGATNADDLFDEAAYLAQYPDVAAAVPDPFPSGWNHYILHGKAEGRCPIPVSPNGLNVNQFNEAAYLARYPDVAAAVPEHFQSGWHHFYLYGESEGRDPYKNEKTSESVDGGM